MMITDSVSVKFVSSRNCFSQLQSRNIYPSYSNALIVIQVKSADATFYVTANQVEQISSGNGNITFNGLFASKQTISNNSQVYIQLMDNYPTCKEVSIEPASTDDWEILELNAEYIQSHLLDQVRVVWPGATLPVWVEGNMCIFIKVGTISPSTTTCAVLQPMTELFVSPKARHTKPHVSFNPDQVKDDDLRSEVAGNDATLDTTRDLMAQLPSTTSPLDNVIGYLKSWWTSPSPLPDQAPPSEPTPLKQKWQSCPLTPITGRVQVVSCISDDVAAKQRLTTHPNCCYVRRKLLGQKTPSSFLASVYLQFSPLELEKAAKNLAARTRRSASKRSDPITPKSEIFLSTICVFVIDELELSIPVSHGHVLFTEDYCTLHRITATSKVRLSKNHCTPSTIKSIQVQPTSFVPEFLNQNLLHIAFTSFIEASNCSGLPVVLSSSNHVEIPLSKDKKGSFLIMVEPTQVKSNEENVSETTLPTTEMFYLLDKTNSADVTVNVEMTESLRCNSSVIPENIPHKFVDKPSGMEEPFNECLDFILAKPQTIRDGALLVTGSRGTGKTSFCTRILARAYRQHQYYTHIIEGKSIRGKRLDAMKRYVDGVLDECVWRQPSILFIDDLHVLCRAPTGPEEELSPEILYSSKISEVIKDALCWLWRQNGDVAVIGSSLSRDSVFSKLTCMHGTQLFHKTTELCAPSQKNREAILNYLMMTKGATERLSANELQPLAARIEGYVVRDIVSLVNRAVHASTITNQNVWKERLSYADFEAALNGFTPSSLRGVSLHTPGDYTWKDVGGLHEIQRQLVRILEWPAKYRRLYAQCPIRLQSGILLYGAPGTGKSLLAAVVAKEMNLNFISIKGPELLNKYIGASEQAVRNTFSKAQSVSPCILFFDEFESLAPRRGHDSTGVTDRVVNQLLTHLDGVEALEGVYVLAATSRPDLIDPALLRPGRLDKALNCGIPTPVERVEIFQSLTRHLSMEDQVDYKQVADLCEHFTGADIKALLVNAQLDAIHQAMAINEAGVARPSSDEKRDSDDLVDGFCFNCWGGRDNIVDISPALDCYDVVKAIVSSPSSSRVQTPSVEKPIRTIQIKQEHLLRAATDMSPSVSSAERKRYAKIYQQFVSSKKDKEGQQIPRAQQRVSLA